LRVNAAVLLAAVSLHWPPETLLRP
jgi:hypothetical protein